MKKFVLALVAALTLGLGVIAVPAHASDIPGVNDSAKCTTGKAFHKVHVGQREAKVAHRLGDPWYTDFEVSADTVAGSRVLKTEVWKSCNGEHSRMVQFRWVPLKGTFKVAQKWQD